MNWEEILKNSVHEQERLLDKAKDEKRGFTEDEEKSFNTLQDKIAEAEKMIGIQNKVSKNNGNLSTLTPPIDDNSNNVPIANVRVTNNPPKWENGIGTILQAVARSTKTGEMDSRFQNAAQGGNETIPADGGFLVGETMVKELLKRTYDMSAVAGRCRRRPISNGNRYVQNYIDETSRVNGSRMGGVLGYWVDEAGTITKSKPKLGQIDIKLVKLAGLYYATSELLEDAAPLQSEIQDWFADEFAFLLDDAIIRGNGTGKPTGILNSKALVSVAKESGQVADTIVYENIVKMWARMWARSRSNAVWFINQDVEPELHTMAKVVGTGGVPVYLPANGLAGAPYATLYGRPVIPIEQCSTLGDKGDIFFVDMNQYLLVEKGGIKAARSIHVQFLTDQEAFRFTYRVNGQSIWQSALTPYKGTNTQSPFITLDARA